MYDVSQYLSPILVNSTSQEGTTYAIMVNKYYSFEEAHQGDPLCKIKTRSVFLTNMG